MARRITGIVTVVVVVALLGSLSARAERLEGQYRGPTDKPVTIDETEDKTIEPAERKSDGNAQDPDMRKPAGEAGDESDPGTEDPADPNAPAPEPAPPSESSGGKYYGPASGDQPPGDRDPKDPPPSGSGGDSSSPPPDDSGSGRPATDPGGSIGGGGATIGGGGGGLGTGVPGGKGARTDATEGYKLWSFYWEHNRERLLHDLLEVRRQQIRLAPWSASWVLGQGEKSLRQTRPVTHGVVAEEILPLLKSRRTDGNALVRDAAVIALGKIGGKDVVPLLVESALEDPDPDVREDATLALGLTREPEALPTLLHILRGQGIPGGVANVNHRCFAAFAVGLLDHEDAASVMMAEFEKAVRARADESLLASMALGIGLLGDGESVKSLAGYLVGPRVGKTVKAHIASAIGKSGLDGSSRYLQYAWKNADPIVRGSIALAMGSYADDPTVTFLDEEGLGDGEGQNQNFSAMSLARIGAELPLDSAGRRRVLVRLHETAAKPQKNSTLAEHAALGLAVLGEDAGVENFRGFAESRREKHHVRSAMALSVGILGDRSSVNRLRDLLASRGEDPKLRSYAALGLAMLGDDSQAKFLREQFARAGTARDVQRGCVLALGVIGSASDVDFLIDEVLTESDDATVRGAATIALGLMRDATAVTKLIRIANSRNASVSVQDKAFAIAALGYLADKDPFPYLSRVFENCNHRHEYPQLAELLRIL